MILNSFAPSSLNRSVARLKGAAQHFEVIDGRILMSADDNNDEAVPVPEGFRRKISRFQS